MTAQKHIEDWITNFLSITSIQFNNLPPCPYAKQAWTKGKVLVIESQDPKNYDALLEEFEVIIYAYNPSSVTADELYKRCLEISNTEIVALDDHPDNIEQVNGIVLNNGKYALILIQKRDKLEQARTYLKSKDYYKNWTKEYFQEVLDV